MSELNLIKTALYNSSSIQEALARLNELNIAYSESDLVDFYNIDNHDIQFWVSRSNKCPLTVCINGQFQIYEDRTPFLARQLSAVEPLVTAENSPENVGERPTFTPCSTSISRLIKPTTLRKTLLQNDLLAAVDFSPAIINGTINGYAAQIWLKTPTKNKFVQIPFDTDRPFIQQSEVIHLFYTAGVPKSRIHYVAPFGSVNYQTAEVL